MLILCFYNFILAFYVFGLWIYQNMMISENITTHEDIKKVWKIYTGNPFNAFEFCNFL